MVKASSLQVDYCSRMCTWCSLHNITHDTLLWIFCLLKTNFLYNIINYYVKLTKYELYSAFGFLFMISQFLTNYFLSSTPHSSVQNYLLYLLILFNKLVDANFILMLI